MKVVKYTVILHLLSPVLHKQPKLYLSVSVVEIDTKET